MKIEPVGKPYISVIISAKDATSTIDACVSAVLAQLDFDHSYEVIVGDDCSTDDTAQIAASLGMIVLRRANAGSATTHRGR